MHLDCLLYGTGASTMFVSMSELIDALAGTLSIWNARDASELSLPCSWTDHSHTDMAMTTVTVVQWHAASIYTHKCMDACTCTVTLTVWYSASDTVMLSKQ